MNARISLRLASDRGILDRIPFPHAAFSALTAAHLLLIELKPGVERPPDGLAGIVHLAAAFAAINALVLVIRRLLGNRHGARHAGLTLLFLVQQCGIVYHLRNHTPWDFSTVFGNSTDLSWRPVSTALAYLGTPGLIIAAGGAAAYFAASRLLDRATPPPSSPRALAATGLFGLIMLASTPPFGPVSFLLRSALRDLLIKPPIAVELADATYPYMQETTTGATALAARPMSPPHIFVVMLESFNANFTEASTPNGSEYTPFLNDLIERGLYLERFYANSIQTSRGHAATFLSVIPSFETSISIRFSKNQWYGVPALLRDHGYRTVYVQSYDNLRFDNARRFYPTIGFERILTSKHLVGETGRNRKRTWGLADRDLYPLLLDKLAQWLKSSPDQPLFVAIAPTSNHFPFSDVADKERIIADSGDDPADNYANSLHRADADLRLFFEALERIPDFANAAVIVTGDHSFPANEHGFAFNQTSYYEEFFRTPFVLVWPGVIEPERRSDGAYSQLDIAPTVADVAGIERYQHHFLGSSVLDPATGHGPVYLVQPYSGRYLAVVDDRWKYIYRVSTGQDWLFDLASDPLETNNRVGDKAHEATADRLRNQLRAIYLNQQLLRRDQIWPRAP